MGVQCCPESKKLLLCYHRQSSKGNCHTNPIAWRYWDSEDKRKMEAKEWKDKEDVANAPESKEENYSNDLGIRDKFSKGDFRWL